MKNKVNILGTEYKVEFRSIEKDANLKNCDGYTDVSVNLIVCLDKKREDGDIVNIKSNQHRVLRHEIIHAFMHESGLWFNSGSVENWAVNEEMTDWIAIQFPKIYKVFKELDILE